MSSDNYKIVVNIVFPDGNEEYVVWEPLMYGEMIDRKIDFNKLFFNSPDAITTPPLEVHLFLYHNPTVTNISQNTGSNKVIRQLLLGKRICHIRSF